VAAVNTTYNSFSNQDNGNSQLLNGNTELKLSNNAWKFIDFPYTVTANTVLQLEFKSDIQGEILKLHGTQNWGISTYDNYPNNGQWVTYNINVGAAYTGVTDRLLFVADHDGGSRNGDSFYRNIVVFEDANSNGICDGSESSVIASFGDSSAIAGNIATEGLALEIYPNPVKGSLLNVSTFSKNVD